MKKRISKKIKLIPSDFEKMFGEKLSPYVKNKITDYNFSYYDLSSSERDGCLKIIFQTLLKDFIVYAGEHRQKHWEKGWNENFKNLSKNNKIDEIIPKYFKYDVLRINQKFIKISSKSFEKNSLAVIINWLSDKYMRGAHSIYEFGCGTGHHLLNIREINPKANIWGLDWAKSSQKIIKKIAEQLSDSKLFAQQFDFFHPNKNLVLDKDSVIYTVAALEQTGSNFKPFIKYILKNKPKLCIHIEPITELLDETNLLDYLSIKYFEKRNYLSGFLDYLKELEKGKKIKIIKTQRTYMGSLFIDGYSVIIWKPL
ncbi:MAG: hypothetical protein KAS02_00480 [Candidatus Pacebacteria bacterium]|nr:hypothetical protein [Candidatus Paceibacterota bacterium]